MKWAFSIQRKIRVAIFMAFMMLAIILFTLIESYNVTKISKSFSSIYEDRLIPAAYLHQIAGNINDRNQMLTLFLFSDTTTHADLKTYLDNADKELNLLLNKYEQTYLVKDEQAQLLSLKKLLGDFRRDEKVLTDGAASNKEVTGKIYLNNTLPLFHKLSAVLLELTKMQAQVGKELLSESQSIASDSSVITDLQIVIAIIIGLMIIVLVVTSKEIVFKSTGNFNLN